MIGLESLVSIESFKVVAQAALMGLFGAIILSQVLKCILQAYLGRALGSVVASTVMFGLMLYALDYALGMGGGILAGLESITGGSNMYSLSLSQVTGLLSEF